MTKKWISTGLAFVLATILPGMADVHTPSPSGGASQSGSRHPHGARAGTHGGKAHVQDQRARREARLAALRSKQISGSLSDREQKQLVRLEKWNANRVQHHRRHAKEG